MLKRLRDIILANMAKLRKDGTPDMRYKENQVKTYSGLEKEIIMQKELDAQVDENPLSLTPPDEAKEDPHQLFNRVMKENNLKLDFDVILEGTIVETKYGFFKAEENILTIRPQYADSK